MTVKRIHLAGCVLISLCAFSQPEASLAVRQLQGFPADHTRKHDRDFQPSSGMKQLSGNLFVYEDTCNVYIVRHGDRALLVGFGSGDVLARLPEIGVRRVDQVLLTHHHRNQAQGLCDLPDYEFRVAVPELEAPHFENAEGFWRDVRLYINYNCRSHWNTIRKNVRVDRRLRPGEEVAWGNYSFTVLETPGPTEHAASYAVRIDGRKVVFCGNLLSGAGKAPNWFDLHWDYYGFTQGIDASDKSFARIAAEKPDLLLPSQGGPIADPLAAMEASRRTYAELREILVPNRIPRVRQELRPILPHLVFVGANCYAILSDSGKAFLWDYGYVDRSRIEELKHRFNVKRIDAVSFSHYHDDHNIRAHELLWEDSKIWIHESMLDVFEHPERYRLPCLIPFPIRADKVLRDGEKVRWEEYSLEFFHLPGQTEFHQGLLAVIDGKKVLFTGDNTWNSETEKRPRNGPVVPQNEYFLDGGFIRCAGKMLEIMPDLVCPAHNEEYSPSRADLEGFSGWAKRLREAMTALIDQPDPNFGMDYRWCHIYPYRVMAAPGETVRVEVRLRNHLFKPAAVRVRLRLPPGVRCERAERECTVAPKTQVAVPFDIRTPSGERMSRQVITADITINGRRIGEYAEALVDPK